MFKENIEKRRAQTTLEYSVIISIIVAALLSTQVYIKRSLQGKLRSVADEIGQQYDPRNTLSDITTGLISDVTTGVESRKENGKLTTTTTVTINDQSETRSGWEEVGVLNYEL